MAYPAFAFALILSFTYNGVQAQEPDSKLPPELAALDAQFNALKAERVTAPFEADVATLNAGYLDRLKKMIAEEKAAGNLDNILALDTEQEHVVFQQTIPGSDDEKTLPGLKTMRGIYREAHAKLLATQAENLTALVEPLAKRLAQLESDLAKADRIADAKTVRAYREKVGAMMAQGPKGASTPESAASTPLSPSRPPSEVSAIRDSLDPGHDLSKLPVWLQDAAKSGGKLRIWGTQDGKPIEEKEILKDFSESDFTRAVAGRDGLILGVRRQGKGSRFFFNSDLEHQRRIQEFKSIQAFDRRNGVWLADDYFHAGNREGEELDLGANPFVEGQGDGRLIRLASGDWIACGYHWGGNPEDPAMGVAMQTVCDLMKIDEPEIVASERGGVVYWITKENKLRHFRLALRPGSATEVPVTGHPTEKIVEFLLAGQAPYGAWIARGESGAVYAEAKGGFSTPIAELSPATALRYASSYSVVDGKPIQSNTLAAQKPDGTWQAMGNDEELKQQIAGIGPALDLDLSDQGEKLKFVVWIEPKTGLKR
ncbi:MAG: hypothetical protein ABL994_10390 [Verrucomicrobiales bacterium]